MNNRQLELLPPEIARSLAALDRKVRVLAMLRGIAWLVILVLAGIGAGILLDLWLDLGESLRVGLLAGLGLACCAVIVWGILRPLFRKTAPTEIAALFETAHPELRERLSSSVELLDVSEPETLKGSPLMRELLLRETTEVVRGADLGDAVDGARAQKAGWIAVAVMFLMVLPLFYSRDGYLLLLTRFFAPWQNLERASNLYFVVDRGDRTVPRGSDVNLLAEPRWRLDTHEIPDEVWLNWTNDGGEADVRRMLWDPDLKAFTATLPHVFHPFDFNVTSDAARTRDYHVNVVEPPSIASLMVDVQPPAYTGLPAQRLDGAVGETVVFERSRVRFELQFNKPVASAEVVWLSPPVHTPIVHNQLTGAGTVAANGAPDTLTPVQEKVPFDLSSDRTSGTLEFDALPDIGGRFALRLTDEHDLQNDDEPLRSLRVQPDLPPNIAFADRVDAPEARPDDVVPIPVTAEDDIAVHELELHYSVVPQGGRNAVSAEGRLLGVKSVDYSFRLDLARLTTDLGAPLPLKNNDRLRIRVRAADERPIPGPNEAWTEERTITIRDDAEPYGFEMIAQTRDQWRDLLESIQRELEQNRQQIGELKEEAESDLRQEVAFDENQALPPLAAHQREQATRLDQLSALLASSPLYANLAKQTQAVAHEELVEAPAALDAAFPAELAQKPEQLAKSAEQLDAALAKLEGLSEGFDEIARLERDLSEIQRLAEQAQRLSEDAIALEEERNNPPADLPPERQQSRDAALEMARQDLAAEHQELADDLSNLLDRRPEILDAAREQQFDRLRELAQQALNLAEPQDQLANDFAAEAQQVSEGLQEVVEKQQQLARDAAELAGAVEPNQAQRMVEPLDLDAIRAALDDLTDGNAEAAAQQQEQSAAELERLAAELRKNELLPADPQEAARELARREDELKRQIEPIAQAHKAARETLKKTPEDAAAQEELQRSEQQLRNLAAAQTAIQAAIANLDVPANDMNRRQGAARRAFETTQRLLDERPERALETAEGTRQALEGLANDIGDPERRRKEAQAQARRLREQQEQLAREAADIAKRSSEGQGADETQQQLDGLAERERAVARELADLDVPAEFEPRQNEGLRRTAATLKQLAEHHPEESAQVSREAAQSLSDLEQTLDKRAAATDQLAQIAPQEDAIAGQVQNEENPPSGDALRQAARDQRDLARQVNELKTPLLDQERSQARQQLEEAARAADEAANGDADKLANARREAGEAREAVQQLQERVQSNSAATASAESQQAMQSQLAQTLNSDEPGLSDLATRAEEFAERQAGLREQTQSLANDQAATAMAEAAAAATPADENQPKEQREQQRREREQQFREQRQQQEQRSNDLRQQQDQLVNDLRQLPNETSPLSVAAAQEQADDSRDALGRREAAEAAESQAEAEQALRDLAAAARGRMTAEQQQANAAAQEAFDPDASQEAREDSSDRRRAAPSEQLAGRAEQLAAAQRQLAEAIRNARQQQLAQGETRAPAAQESPAEPTADTSDAAPSTTGEAAMDAAQQARSALEAQQQLARDAAELALQTAEQTGADSEQTAAALRMAEQAAQAADAAARGQLPRAMQAGDQAREAAGMAAEQLEVAGEGTPEAALAEQASALAERQQAVAQQMNQVASSPAGRSAAQAQAQQRMAAQAEHLAEQFADVAQELGAQPLDRPQQGQQAGAAEQASEQASQAIGQSAGDLSTGNPQQASAQARQGAEQLRQAAQQALQAAGDVPAQPSQVPQSVGQTLTQAMRQLQQAGEQLAQMPSPAANGQDLADAGQQPSMQAGQQPNGEGSPTSTSENASPSGEGQPGETQPGAEGQPQSGQQMAGADQPTAGEGAMSDGEGQPGDAAGGMPQPSATNSLQQVAQSLNQAAEQLGLTPGQAQGQRTNSQQQGATGSPTTDGESSDGGAQETLRLTNLEEQLQNISSRNWGELPGKLQTDILQSSQQRTGGDYGKVIQRYFEEVSRSRSGGAVRAEQ